MNDTTLKAVLLDSIDGTLLAAGVDTIALRCGGWWTDADLAGAAALHDTPAILLRHWSDSPLARSRSR